MNVLLISGEKTQNIVNAIGNRFTAGAINFLVEKSIIDLERFYDAGHYFDRAVVVDMGISLGLRAFDASKIRERVCNFIQIVQKRARNKPKIVFICEAEEMASIIREETMAIGPDTKILLAPAPYTATFMSRAVSLRLEELVDNDYVRMLESRATQEVEDDGIPVDDSGEMADLDKLLEGVPGMGAKRIQTGSARFLITEKEIGGTNLNGEVSVDSGNGFGEEPEVEQIAMTEELPGMDDDEEDLEGDPESDQDFEDEDGGIQIDDQDPDGGEFNWDNNDEGFPVGGWGDPDGDQDGDQEGDQEGDLAGLEDGWSIPAEGSEPEGFAGFGDGDPEDLFGLPETDDQGNSGWTFEDGDGTLENLEDGDLEGFDWGGEELPQGDEADGIGVNDDKLEQFDDELGIPVDEPEQIADEPGISVDEPEEAADELGISVDEPDISVEEPSNKSDGLNIHVEEPHGSLGVEALGLFSLDGADGQGEELPEAFSEGMYTGKKTKEVQVPEVSASETPTIIGDIPGITTPIVDKPKGTVWGLGKGKAKGKPQPNNVKKAQTNPVQAAPVAHDGAVERRMAELNTVLKTYRLRGHVIAVTGMPSSGKTTIANNIADVANDLGCSVLLADFDVNGRGLAFTSKQAFDAVHSLGVDSSSIRQAVNSYNGSISGAASIISPGKHLLTTALGSDPLGSDWSTDDKLSRFCSSIKSQYQITILDIPWEYATQAGSKLLYNSDEIVITSELGNHDLMGLLLRMCNLEDEQLSEMLFTQAKLLLTKVKGLSELFGRRVSGVRGVLNVMDETVTSLLGEAAEQQFSDMLVAGQVPYDPEYEKYWLTKGKYTESKGKWQLYADVLHSLLING